MFKCKTGGVKFIDLRGPPAASGQCDRLQPGESGGCHGLLCAPASGTTTALWYLRFLYFETYLRDPKYCKGVPGIPRGSRNRGWGFIANFLNPSVAPGHQSQAWKQLQGLWPMATFPSCRTLWRPLVPLSSMSVLDICVGSLKPLSSLLFNPAALPNALRLLSR